MLSDIVHDLLPFRIYCDLFYCKRGFNIIGRCQYCTRFFVDSPRTSCDMEKNLTFHKSEMNEEMVRFSNSLLFRLNANYVSVVCSIKKQVVLTNAVNLGVIHYDKINSPMVLYVYYLEIFVRVYMNIMRKHILNKIFENLLSKSQKEEIVNSYSRQFLTQTSHHARKLVSHLNLLISEKHLKYVYENTRNNSANLLRH